MEKNIYELLNDVVINEKEYEQTEFSDFDKARSKQRVLRKVRALEMKNKKNSRGKAVAAAAAACAVVIGAVGFTNPALADVVYSNTIGRLIENKIGTKDENEASLYKAVAENSLTAQEEVAKSQNADDYNTSAEAEGISVSISDIYCDGYVVYYTAVLQTDNEELKQADFITAEKGGEELTVNGNQAGGVMMGFEKASDGSYVKSGEIDLIGFGSDGDTEDYSKTDSLEIKYVITNLAGYKDDEWDDNGEYVSTASVDGDWTLKFPVTVDRSENVTYDFNKEDNGLKLCNAVKTKAGLVLTIETPDFAQAPYNDPYNDPDMSVVDENGNALQWFTGGISQENEDGSAVYKIMVLYEGQTNLSLEVTSRDEEQREIASIPFEIK